MQIYVNALSEQGERLPVVPAAAYYSDTLSPARADIPLDTFCLPDNLDRLVSAFVGLDGAKRRRFLRSAAAIYTARELWDLSISSYFLICVQAIETMVDRPPPVPCAACNRDMGPGPTRLFREFVERYCPDSGVEEKVVIELYRVRSALAHGHYLFQLDEAPWSFNMGPWPHVSPKTKYTGRPSQSRKRACATGCYPNEPQEGSAPGTPYLT
jgi:hypothetical protein